MEQYIVSARKYRPSTFATVVGQEALTTTLKNAIASDRLAHAYLFCGSRGVGKTSCARIFAKTINCTNRSADGEACNECDSCRQFNQGRSMNIVELDAASHNGVDDIKQLIEQVMMPPTTGRYRVFIVDEVHMLSSAAFNAFLKTLEEPPSYVVFILATTEKYKIIPTILSRCQIYDFARITPADMVAHMTRVAAAEGIAADPAALGVIARKADGAMRDALSIFDQMAASTGGNITYEATIENLNVLDHSYYSRLVDAFAAQDVARALLIYKEIRERGFDSQFFINGLGQYMRDLMVASNPSTVTLLEATDDIRAEMAERGARLHPTFLYKAMDLCNEADFNYRQASNKQFLIELTLIKLCQLLSPSPDDSGSDGGHELLPLTRVESQSASSAPAIVSAVKVAQPQSPAVAAESPSVSPASPVRTTDPSRSAPATPRQAYRPGGMSLRRHASAAAAPTPEDKPEQPQVKPVRTSEYTAADFESAWKRCVQLYREEPIIAGCMAAATPERSAPGAPYRLRTTSTIQAGAVNEELEGITARMRDFLANDTVAFEVVTEEAEDTPELWTTHQLFENLLREHPNLSALMDDLKMRII